MAIFGLASPWVEHARKIEALFKQDPDVCVAWADDCIVRIYVADPIKAEAMAKVIAPEKDFGNVTLKIDIVPGNEDEDEGKGRFFNFVSETLYDRIFVGNRAFLYSTVVNGVGNVPITYVVFAPDVVQYKADDISDLYGLRSTLYEDLARDVFDFSENPDCGAYFCTERCVE